MTDLNARTLMAQDPQHRQLAAWAMALQHSWEPNREPWEEGELPWVEDMVEAAFVLLGVTVSVHEADKVEQTLQGSALGATYLSAWYLMTCAQYGQQV